MEPSLGLLYLKNNELNGKGKVLENTSLISTNSLHKTFLKSNTSSDKEHVDTPVPARRKSDENKSNSPSIASKTSLEGSRLVNSMEFEINVNKENFTPNSPISRARLNQQLEFKSISPKNRSLNLLKKEKAFKEEMDSAMSDANENLNSTTTFPSENSNIISLQYINGSNNVSSNLGSSINQNPHSFPCLWQGCNLVLSTRTGLATHASDHIKIHFKSDSIKKQKLQVVCRWNNCNMWFENIILLAKHLASENHIGQTPYIPKDASIANSSSDDSDLKHKKRFPCKSCNKTFSSSSNLRVHEKLHDPNRQRHACTISPCKKSYSTEADLKIHMRSHRGEFTYKCSYPSCSEMFVRASQLYAHERVHDNIAVLKCGLCGKRFRMKNELGIHEKEHLVSDAKILLDSLSSTNQAIKTNSNTLITTTTTTSAPTHMSTTLLATNNPSVPVMISSDDPNPKAKTNPVQDFNSNSLNVNIPSITFTNSSNLGNVNQSIVDTSKFHQQRLSLPINLPVTAPQVPQYVSSASTSTSTSVSILPSILPTPQQLPYQQNGSNNQSMSHSQCIQYQYQYQNQNPNQNPNPNQNQIQNQFQHQSQAQTLNQSQSPTQAQAQIIQELLAQVQLAQQSQSQSSVPLSNNQLYIQNQFPFQYRSNGIHSHGHGNSYNIGVGGIHTNLGIGVGVGIGIGIGVGVSVEKDYSMENAKFTKVVSDVNNLSIATDEDINLNVDVGRSPSSRNRRTNHQQQQQSDILTAPRSQFIDVNNTVPNNELHCSQNV